MWDAEVRDKRSTGEAGVDIGLVGLLEWSDSEQRLKVRTYK